MAASKGRPSARFQSGAGRFGDRPCERNVCGGLVHALSRNVVRDQLLHGGGQLSNGFPAYVYLFNPNTNPITVTATTDGGITSVVVPGTNGVTQFTMPVGSGGSFICPTNFYAICTVNAPPGNGTTYNWGFSLVPTEKLTTETDVGWAPGSADLSDNGSPVWVTPLASTTIYVVYGDGTPAYTDSAQGKYSTNYTVAAYESKQVFDPSKNQSGMRLYTLDGTLITAAWGESADASQAGNPDIDAGYTVLPFPVPTLKKSVVNLSNPGQPVSTNGTLLQYTITIANNNLLPLETIAPWMPIPAIRSMCPIPPRITARYLPTPLRTMPRPPSFL